MLFAIANCYKRIVKCIKYSTVFAHIFKQYNSFYLDSLDSLHRANNLLITVADRAEDLFYTHDNTTAAENLCAFHEGELGYWAHIRCSFVLQGRFVQVQNHLLPLHLGEVEVFGF